MNREERRYILKRMQQLTDYFLDTVGDADTIRKRTPGQYRHRDLTVKLESAPDFADWFCAKPRTMPTYKGAVPIIKSHSDYRRETLYHLFPEYLEEVRRIEQANVDKCAAAKDYVVSVLRDEQARCDQIMLAGSEEALKALDKWQDMVKALSDGYLTKFTV